MEIILLIVNFLFFLWFGNVMSSILRTLREIKEGQLVQTRLLASLANATKREEP